tara:strand:- start:9464 stop:10258 length:795 start_codon:yes stop_codon:yes gene_type:complete
MNERIKKTFTDNKKKLVTFITGGDPSINLSNKIIKIIANSGADLIEIGMPFSDPMADGPIIQLSSNRAINKGVNLDDIFSICKKFRNLNNSIPLILMGYYNVILNYGIKNFVNSCKINGVDGLIIVDLQPEEDEELLLQANSNNISLIRLITPTTNSERLKTILKNSSGFLYYVTITGITGQKSANLNNLKNSIKEIRKYTNLPIVSGFGIKNKKHVNDVCQICDGAIVGSSLIEIIQKNLNDDNKILNNISRFVKELKEGTNI